MVRNVLAACKYDYIFTVLLDCSRVDLIREIFDVIKAVRNADLRKNIGFVTWQELTNVCGKELKDYITVKYF